MSNKLTIKIGLGSLFFYPKKSNSTYIDMYSVQQYIDYFLPNTFNYQFITDNNINPDIMIWDIYSNNDNASTNNINMLISVENCNKWKWYRHHTKFGDYSNNKMNIYLYNHITLIEKTDNYISIPIIHNRINYYLLNESIIKPIEITSFNDKKFCLMINKSKHNNDIDEYVKLANDIGPVDNINLYDKLINTKSCYNSVELLNIFNKYKFIICFENSYEDGYITEKIFNCFFAKTLPIYKGSLIIDQYINTQSFIDGRDIQTSIELLKILKSDELLYNKYITSKKISNSYNNENYQEELGNFIMKKLGK